MNNLVKGIVVGGFGLLMAMGLMEAGRATKYGESAGGQNTARHEAAVLQDCKRSPLFEASLRGTLAPGLDCSGTDYRSRTLDVRAIDETNFAAPLPYPFDQSVVYKAGKTTREHAQRGALTLYESEPTRPAANLDSHTQPIHDLHISDFVHYQIRDIYNDRYYDRADDLWIGLTFGRHRESR